MNCSGPTFKYRYQGYYLLSDFRLHSLEPTSRIDPEANVIHVKAGQPVETQHILKSENWLIAGRAFGFDLPRMGRVVIVGGDAIYFDPAHDAEATLFEQVLLGSAFAVAVMQRGQFCLHAAVLTRAGRTVAFCGDSGEGKSTLAMSLSLAGWEVLTDDLALVRVRDGAVHIENNGRHLRLWRESLEAMGHGVEGLVQISQAEEKYFVRAPIAAGNESFRLNAICILSSDAIDAAYSLESISGMAALAQLRRHTYRHEFLSMLGCDLSHLRHSTAVVATVPLYRLHRPRALDRLGELAAFLDSVASNW